MASPRTARKAQTIREVCPSCGRATTTVVADTPIAQAIFAKRKRHALSVRQAAEMAGVSPSTLCRVERGKMPDVESAVKLAEWLGESLDALFRHRAAAAASAAPARPGARDGGER